jgi:hypothetical protein
MKTWILIGLLGALLVVVSFDLYERQHSETLRKANVIRLTQASTNATIEAVLGPRMSGDRPREYVWTDGHGNMVGEEFLLTNWKTGERIPKAQQKAVLDVMVKQGMIRLEEHCHGTSGNHPPPAPTFGYCTFEKAPLGLEG